MPLHIMIQCFERERIFRVNIARKTLDLFEKVGRHHEATKRLGARKNKLPLR
jgi:hypothetical protein